MAISDAFGVPERVAVILDGRKEDVKLQGALIFVSPAPASCFSSIGSVMVSGIPSTR
jgi:hypothetical protein